MCFNCKLGFDNAKIALSQFEVVPPGMENIIEIDGSFLAGGGQILRTACGLSVITKKPCRIFNIRKNRENPGLANQHLLGIRGLRDLCSGKLTGDQLGSEEIEFFPGETGAKSIEIKIDTAASITLLLQTLIGPMIFSPEKVSVNISGGATDTFFSPTIDYLRYVFLKILEEMGADRIKIEISKRGYYPEGGSLIKMETEGAKLKPIDLTRRGNLKKITVVSGAAEFLKDKKVAERQLAGAREILGRIKFPLEEKTEYYDTSCPGSQICLFAEFENTVIGSDSFGKIGKPAEEVGKEAALSLLKEEKAGACLDKHLGDQILAYMALAKNGSQISVSEITEHLKTNAWVIERFLPGKFIIKDNLVSWLPNP